MREEYNKIIDSIVFIVINKALEMQQDSFDKQMSMTNKKEKIFNVRKVHYKQFDHEKYLKPTYTPFHIKEHTEEPLSSKISKKGGQYNYQVAIISSPAYKQLTKKYNHIKDEYNKQKQLRLQQLSKRQEQLTKCKAQKQRIDAERIKIIQRRDELRYKIEEIRERNQILKNEQMQRREEYRLMNMEYLRNMIIGMKYQDGMEVDIDNMTYEELLELQEKIGSVSKGLSQDQIQKLPKRVINQSDPQQLCSVCYYNAKPSQQLTILSCNHSFHTDCIKEWLMKEKMCPMCKQEIIIKIQSTKKLLVQEGEGSEGKLQSVGEVGKREEVMGLGEKGSSEEEKAQEELLEISLNA